jgi:hypothetical protein
VQILLQNIQSLGDYLTAAGRLLMQPLRMLPMMMLHQTSLVLMQLTSRLLREHIFHMHGDQALLLSSTEPLLLTTIWVIFHLAYIEV